MSSTLRPWETWKLDPKFLDDLTHWTEDHPQRLDRVLDNICIAIDDGRDFLTSFQTALSPLVVSYKLWVNSSKSARYAFAAICRGHALNQCVP
jgi:hypothetical protein